MYVTKYSFGPTTIPRWQRDNYPQTEYEDFVYLERTIPDVDAMAYVIFGGPESMKFEGKTVTGVDVTPVSDGIYAIENMKIANGRFYTESESNSGAPVIVLGHSTAENLFENVEPIGKQIRVYGRKLTVIGVLKKSGKWLR